MTIAQRISTPSAVAWIDTDRAILARSSSDGILSSCTIRRGATPEHAFLDTVVHAIGDLPRIVIMGPSFERLALERAYVAIYHRPDRLLDVEPSEPVGEAELIERLRELAG